MSPGTKKKKVANSKSQLGERSVREQRRGRSRKVEEGRGRSRKVRGYISRYEFLWFVVAYFLGSE